jgi:peroxiredoxin
VLKKFKEANNAPYTFFTDSKGDLAKALGLDPGARQTIVIGKDGKVEHIYKKVSAATHAKDVLKDLPEKK